MLCLIPKSSVDASGNVSGMSAGWEYRWLSMQQEEWFQNSLGEQCYVAEIKEGDDCKPGELFEKAPDRYPLNGVPILDDGCIAPWRVSS